MLVQQFFYILFIKIILKNNILAINILFIGGVQLHLILIYYIVINSDVKIK